MVSEASQAPPAVGSFLTFADSVLAAGSAHSGSCETSPVRAHGHSEGTVCTLTADLSQGKPPELVLLEQPSSPALGLPAQQVIETQ